MSDGDDVGEAQVGAGTEDEVAFDPEARALCPDGNCTGVIGDDGRCKVCGARGEATRSGAAVGSDTGEGDPASMGGGDLDDTSEGELDARELCSDGNCVGLIGEDARCKVCGRPAEAVS